MVLMLLLLPGEKMSGDLPRQHFSCFNGGDMRCICVLAANDLIFWEP
jgi:hypothetical protein